MQPTWFSGSQLGHCMHVINDFYLKIYTGDRSFAFNACIHVASYMDGKFVIGKSDSDK